ncbi:hypothetical protein [Swingsia samuiensis]|uniref:Uncharacterized protein n=1 Tax=Swingsia samuiensis TaxID=1293412 RepID=A0A4Y6UNJ2_9PROT|nr:hypothetical protein [Swingsia samuiensis]QDH17625.1 hypothetical protein E3D00_08685 [Swingsia samuiensis]
MDMELGNALTKSITSIPVIKRAFNDDENDTIGVALDVVAVGLSIGVITAASGWLAIVATIGAAILLLTDGGAWALEVSGDEEDAETFKQRTALLRWTAILASIPDAALGIYKIAQDVPEIINASQTATKSAQNVMKRAEQNATRAQQESYSAPNSAARARSAEYAKKYAELAERAHQRAINESQALQRELKKLALHEVTPRLTVPPSLYLMSKDELNPENHDIIARNLHRLGFHIGSVHK